MTKKITLIITGLLLCAAAQAQTYCTPLSVAGNDEYITHVKLSNINNYTGYDGYYGNYTSQVANVTQGATDTIFVSTYLGDWSFDSLHVYVDWNHNGTLNDAGEEFTLPAQLKGTSYGGTDYQTSSIAISVPSNATLGNTRMRVMLQASSQVQTPCDIITGDIEDYTVNVRSITKLYVDSSLSVSGNGSSWATAFKYLSTALDIANQSPGVDTILVAKGTYYPTGAQNGTNRDSTFLITRGGLKIYGGFPTGGGTFAQRTFPSSGGAGGGTILSGNIYDGSGNNDNTDNSYHVIAAVSLTNVSDSVIFDGVTISDGNANGSGSVNYNGVSFTRNNGAGLRLRINNNEKFTLRNCIIRNNTTTGAGGGMLNESARANIINCVFLNNNAAKGSGVHNNGSNAKIINSTFYGNNNPGGGATIFNETSSSATIANSILWGNTGVGPNITNTSSSPTVSYSDIQQASGVYGGAGNINTNPLFVSATNFQLQPGSPCIDTGSNNAVPSGITTDIACNPRIMSCQVDMGAYETLGPSGSTYTTAIYVDSANGNDANNGTSWNTAFKTLSTALYKAQLCTITDSILVAKGTYYPTGTQADNNRDSTFLIKRGGLKIYGGFPTGGGTFAQRTFPSSGGAGGGTILSGNINNANDNDNSYHVMVIANIAANADSIVVDGLTITQSYSAGASGTKNINGVNVTNNRGALVVMNDSTAQKTVFNNLSISNNRSVWGAGAWVESGSSPLFTHCSFTGNTATNGGGGMNVKANSSPHIIDCIFRGNIAQGANEGGGGLRTETGSQPVITNSSFENNKATDGSGRGGGMYNISSPVIDNCTFTGNSTNNNGGGMYNESFSPTFTDCSFEGNTANIFGGGMYNTSSSPAVTNCSFSGNTAISGGGMLNTSSSPAITNCSFLGNTVISGGGMYNFSSSPAITNCSFSGNTASNGGGGMLNSSSSPTISDCVFSGNSISAYSGGGMLNSSSSPTISNCTFGGNKSPNYGGAIYNESSSNPKIANAIIYGNQAANTGGIYNNGSTATITYSLVQGGYTGTSNMNADPLFVNAPSANTAPFTGGDYSLQPCSPAINAGDPQTNNSGYAVQAGTIDISSTPRIFNARVDMGAYEYQESNGTFASAIYVDSANGNDANNGATWATAFKTLSTALYKAQLCTLTDSILVAKGTYYPTGVQSGTNRDSTFLITRGGLKIYGGFPTGGGTFAQRTLPSSGGAGGGTILSGNIKNANDNTDNSYHVIAAVSLTNVSDSVIFDGVTISDGNANGSGSVNYNGVSFTRNNGAGLRLRINNNEKFTLRNCIIRNNTTTGAGGGMLNESARANIINCVFLNNNAAKGSGVHNNGSNAKIINSTFYGNNNPVGGATIFNETSSSATIANSILWGNTGVGPNITNTSSSPTVSYSDIQQASGVYGGTGNINVDPLFANVSQANLQLQPCSPAINAGRNDSIPTGITTDIMGNNRIYNNATVDMGAYELQNTPPDYGTIVYVDSANGSDAYEGTSWATAFKTLSYALNATQNTGCYTNVDSILIAKGTYYPTGTQAGTNRDSTFLIKRGGLKIYGGFPTGGGTFAQRTLPSSGGNGGNTILSGNINNANDSTDNSYHVMVIAGVPAGSDSVLVDGITVTGGNANGSGNFTYATISTVRSEAGGIYMHTNQELGRKLRIANCSITRNNAMYYGGGLYTQRSSPLIENCRIADNGSGSHGGGMFSYNFSSPLITGCTFHNNNSGSAGGALFQNDSTVRILRSVFTQNKSGSGGAVRLYRAINNGSSNPSFYAEANIFMGNQSIANDGGALSLVMGNGTDTIINNVFANNTTTTNSGNSNNGGGAMVQENGTSTFIANNTFYGNTAASLSGAIRFKDGGSNRHLYNNIFNNNYAGAVLTDISSQTGTAIIQQAGNLFSATDALFVSTTNLIGGDGMWGTADDGLQLNGCSPAINTGSNGLLPATITGDITATPRVYDGLIDIGAYEYQNALTVVNGNVVYVDSTAGNDNNDGISWGTAFKTVAHALALVQKPGCYSNMDSILVAKGTYYPIAQQISGLPTAQQRDSTLLIKRSGLYILGGYDAGSGTRNIASYPTILSGDISNTEDSTQNSYHIMVIAGVPDDGGKVLVDGFTIREGNANGSATNEMNGQNIGRITGGGIHLFNNANTKININHCVLEHHSCVYNGGAIFNSNTSPLITNCIFRDNNGNYDGGGILNIYSSSPVVINCLFYNNIANNGGAIRSGLEGSNPQIINCTFYGNHANNAFNGGAVFHNGGGGTTITNSIIDGNNTGIAGSCTATYSLVQGLPANAVLHNLDGNTDPQFTDAATNDFTVSTVSPTINTGSLSAYNLALFGNTDLGGNIRVAQDSIDMGAYEQLFIPDLTDTITDISGITACGMQNGSFTIAGLSAGITYTVQYVYNFMSLSQQRTANDTGAIVISGLSGGQYSNIVVGAGSYVADPLGPVMITYPTPSHISVNDFSDNTSCSDPNGTLTLGSVSFTPGEAYHIWYNSAYHGIDTVNEESAILLDSLEVGNYNDIYVVSTENCMSDTAAWYVGGVVFPGIIDSAWGINTSGCGTQDGELILTGNFLPGVYMVGYSYNNTSTASLAFADETFIEIPGLAAGTYTNIVVGVQDMDCPSNIWEDTIEVSNPNLSTSIAMQTSSGINIQGSGTGLLYANELCEAIAFLNAADSLGTVTMHVDVTNAAQTYNNEYYVGRYYDIQATNNTGGQVTLYFSPQDFDDYNNLVGTDNPNAPQILPDGSNLMITAFHSNPGSGSGPQNYDVATGQLLPAATVWNVALNRWEVTFTTPHFSGFFAHTNNTGNPLPIKMGDISAINLDAVNRVDWNTISEQQGDRFEIERSKDSRSFTSLGYMDANGIDNSRYSFVDATPYEGINYYRLKIVNNDNTSYYSKVVNATLKAAFDMTAYPNPVKDELTVSITGSIHQGGAIVLSDVTGRVLHQVAMDDEHKHITFSMHGLAAGAYFVTFKDSNHNKTIKVVKE